MVIGTSGHIDHGKTALIKHLTGIETDRLKDEKIRGITIENGYAHLKLDNENTVGFIDVPGHEKFIKTMISGALGFDAVMLVVAADEGIKPQTIEHLHILDHLGINSGIIVITKADLVSTSRLNEVTNEIGHLVKNTVLRNFKVATYSIYDDLSRENLIQALQSISNQKTALKEATISRLYIDRVFTVKGFGTIATGTLIEGQLKKGDIIYKYPGNQKIRVKGIQVYGGSVDEAYYGQRTAINLNVDIQDISRGDLLTSSDHLKETMIIDIKLKLDETSGSVKHWQRLKLYHGTREILCRIALADEQIISGQEKVVQLRLEEPIYCKANDHVILRTYSPMYTIGGGVITNPYASKKDKVNDISNIELELLRILQQFYPIFTLDDGIFEKTSLDYDTGIVTIDKLVTKEELLRLSNSFYITFETWEKIKRICLLEVEKEHQQYPFRAGMSKETLRSKVNDFLKNNKPLITIDNKIFSLILTKLIELEELKQNGDVIALKTFEIHFSDAQVKVKKAIMRTILDYQQPIVPISELQKLNYDKNIIKELLYHLINYEILVKINDENVMGIDDYSKSKKCLLSYFENNESIGVAQCRDLFGFSRKATVLLLEHFDKIQLTKRNENTRTLFKK